MNELTLQNFARQRLQVHAHGIGKSTHVQQCPKDGQHAMTE
jgi:hypothetical protein